MDISKVSRLFLGRIASDGVRSPAGASSTRTPSSEDAVKRSGDLSDTLRPDEARAARVESLRNAVAAGTYRQPDAVRLAEAVARDLF